MEMGLIGKKVLLSGGTSGIGLATAEAFLAEGAKVMLVSRSSQKGKEALEKLSCFGQRVEFYPADVRKKEDCQRAVVHTDAVFQGLDILVASAGIYEEGAFSDIEEDRLRDLFDTNVFGTLFLVQEAIPFLKRRRGNIVCVGSDAGIHGNYFAAAYCATKGAITLFTRALALELASKGVRVNAVAPGDIATPMVEAQLAASQLPRKEALREMASVYPMGRIGNPEEVAALITYLASEKAAFITGAVYVIDGGLTA